LHQTKRLRKPAALRRGDVIGVVAPASPVERELLERGMREIEGIGYRVAVNEWVLARRSFFAGPHAQRAEAFLAYLEDPSIRAIYCSRGGYGSNYVVEHLSARTVLNRLKRLPPKIVMGYSDITTLLLFLHQALGWTTFQGPMVTRELAGGEVFYNRALMEQVLGSDTAGIAIESAAWSLRSGVAEGRLLGGCIPMLTATLGTPQEVDTRGALLLLEDIDEKPFRIDRMLFQLRRAGKFREVRGVIFGEMPGCGGGMTSEEGLREIILDALAELKVPIVFGLPFGHSRQGCLTLPLGVRARLSAGEKVTLTLLEPAVSVPAKPRRRSHK
jgi:muramoyltetrapeptide carboxypeptidase